MKKDDRSIRLLERARQKYKSETETEIELLIAREDYFPHLDYFLDLLKDGGDLGTIAQRVRKPTIALLCLQAPIELFWAQGFFPVKIYSGSYGASNLTSPRLPALMCPTLKAILGRAEMDESLAEVPWVIPLTCDWVVKFKETRELFGEFRRPVHFLEVPRVKDSPIARDRWFYEQYSLSGFLKKIGGEKLKAKNLLAALKVMEEARKALFQLTRLRRRGFIASVFYALITSSFFLDNPTNWTANVLKVVEFLDKKEPKGLQEGIFLSGSPIFFPNFKALHLIEEAGLKVYGDDLCSSERIFPRHVGLTDTSEDGLMRALAEAYHRGCLCPVFAENSHRASIIKEALSEAPIRGVIFHLLKGCHPYELDSFCLEESLKEWGLKYLKIETDYSIEDTGNLLTRLEAFRPTLAESEPLDELAG
ncbi:MAG: 2-hydroxyacyl-CoA dehydratase family protein [Deltaproteobacteria bacterium]|jgi:benzoyl-CoA reductase/2-hydroxyglutaryl-CoA dehydratase subunit BcrC/BadD/HgdB|nr:2-hydroxyacyl-CoA dehydratase family protein [Deltaproteobacteria bacterium]